MSRVDEWLILEPGQLRQLRGACGLSQEAIAAQIPVASRTWARWEKSDRIPLHLAGTVGRLLGVELAPPPRVSNEEAIAAAMGWLELFDEKLGLYLTSFRSASLPRRRAIADLLLADSSVRRGFARFLLDDLDALKAAVSVIDAKAGEPEPPSLDELLDEVLVAIGQPSLPTLQHPEGTPNRIAELEALAEVHAKAIGLLLLAVGTVSSGGRVHDVEGALEAIQRKLGRPLRIVVSD